MRQKAYLSSLTVWFSIIILGCKKSDTGGGGPPPPPDPTILKDASSVPVGVGINYDLMKDNASYSGLVKQHFDRVTAEYQMKHGANVTNSGDFNFTNTDDFFNIVQTGGLAVFGHTLVWHANNNGNYLRSLSGTTGGPNLLANPAFESGFTDWSTQVSTAAPTSGTISLEATDVHSGTQAAKIVVNAPGPDAWSIQIYSADFNVASGSNYKLTYWAKAAANDQSLRVVTQGTSYYTALNQTLTTTWTQYSFSFTPAENAISIKFHFPNAGTFLLDDLFVAASSTVLDQVQIKSALQNWVTTMATRYKGKVTGWDVVNEIVTDGTGELRTSTNSSGAGPDHFYWADYLGRGYIADAFRWANAADPAAKLFINDYNLESDNRKLDSVIKIINELKAASVPIHGVGLQMHISINTGNAGIDNALTKLAATGLLIHISEMDVRINPSDANPFTPTQALLDQQAQKYRYVAEAYFRLVPASQRFGITVWNLTDADSWIVTPSRPDAPTLFGAGYNKKPAFNEFIKGLQ